MMSDDFLSDLTLEDDDSGPQRGAAFYVTPPVEPALLQTYCLMHRNAATDYPGAGSVLFTAIDEETGAEVWDDTSTAIGQRGVPQISEARRWQRILSFPREPTIAEALEWQRYQNARAESALWYALEAERARQAVPERRAGPSTRPDALPGKDG